MDRWTNGWVDGGWISKMWFIHKMEYYSAIKRDEALTHVP